VLRAKLCELLQIDAPILLAPMGPEIAGLELAAAVSNAGGRGMISLEGIRQRHCAIEFVAYEN
jgi:NAD(P)H-dependent flavin oxidoreductase YrpB (nitropropane dioxygenase family)